MNDNFLEAGKIINTHGIKGEVKIEPWADSPKFLLGFKHLYIDGKCYNVNSSRVHQRFVIASLEGISTMNDAERYKNKIIYRSEAKLSEGQYFISDLIGFTAIDEASGSILGNVTDIISLPGGDVIEIKGQREILVPLRPEFVIERNMENKTITLRLIEGM
jgi:16S rRNA processing protein RimM